MLGLRVRHSLFALIACFLLCTCPSNGRDDHVVTIRLANIPLRSATGVQNLAELAVFDAFFKKHPNYLYERVTGLALPEGLSEAQQMMAFAGDRAPDVFDLSIRQVQNYIRQGLLYPLDDIIREYRKRTPDWKPPSLGLTEHHYDAARGPDGRLYAIVSDYWILGLWYRRDLFEEAGIVPPRPPKDWQEFFEFAQRLTYPEKHVKGARFQTGQYGTALRTGYTAGYIFTNFVYQANGDMTVQERTCPYDGTVSEFRQEDKVCLCRRCGRSLANQPPRWKAAYGREPGQRALRFYKRLRWTEWVRCPSCETPNNLPVVVCPKCKEENPIRAKAEQVACRVCGTVIPIKPEQYRFVCKRCGRDLRGVPVITGVVHVGGDPVEMFLRGEIAMMLDHINPQVIDRVLTEGGLRPDQIGLGPPPSAGEGGVRAVLTGGRAWCISARAARDPRVLRAAWEYLVFRCSEEAQRIITEVYVRNGYAHLIRPQMLQKFGFTEEYEDYEPTFRRAMEEAPKYGRIQPHDPYYQHVEGHELAVPIDTILYDGGQYKDPAKVIQTSMDEVNAKLYRVVPPEVERRRNFWGTVIFLLVAPLVVYGFVWAMREQSEVHVGALQTKATQVVGSGARHRYTTILAWSVMLPALLTVALWQYLPLLRGTLMAFYDYKIYGESTFLGLANFIEVMTSPDFWNSVRATVLYVGLNLAIGFVAPIFVALLLHEVPRGKILFRVIFYLPAVTTGLVIMFLWKMFYDPTPYGFLNRIMIPILHALHLIPQDVRYIDWLHTPGLAMLCVGDTRRVGGGRTGKFNLSRRAEDRARGPV